MERMLASLDRYLAVQAPSVAAVAANETSAAPESMAMPGDERSATTSPGADDLVGAANAVEPPQTGDISATHTQEQE
jgi:hypothetical protein